MALREPACQKTPVEAVLPFLWHLEMKTGAAVGLPPRSGFDQQRLGLLSGRLAFVNDGIDRLHIPPDVLEHSCQYS